MNTTQKQRGGSRPNTGGRREGSGRKTSRPIDRGKPVYLFKDQLPISPGEVREAVDQFLNNQKSEQ